LSLLLGAACDRRDTAADWKKKFADEVNYHYQTQRIKNKEIAVRDEEIENQKKFIVVLEERIEALEARQREKEVEFARFRLYGWRLEAKITAVDAGKGFALMSAGQRQGVKPGDEVDICRGDERIATGTLYAVGDAWGGMKLTRVAKEPRAGDSAAIR
jgi:hypothetical protein